MTNISREEILVLSDDNTVGLIYSRSDLQQYLVELIQGKKTEYLHDGRELAIYTTMDAAVRDARKHGAQNFFLCFDNTYEECGLENTGNHLSYLPIHPRQ
ncbi:hypothetical protein [Legionella spiritensis]|uniref:hypothetical protein n=1 Tax=Legionella spiritensis TaxID=452 RepID=UPI000F6FFF02|nr:hypothetical protein [Legionella spiritensis]VEG92045.1 Uncharacterised protein [Legionella spiritensis]